MPNPTRVIWMIAIAETLVWSGLFYSFPALIVWWERDFGWSKPELTGALTLAIVTSALVSPLTGRLIDRGRGPLVLTVGAAFGGLTMLLLAVVDTHLTFYLAWIALGAAMGCCLYEPCFAFLTRARGERAVQAITLVSLVAGFAGTLSFPLGHVVAQASGWRMAALVYGGLILLVAVPLMWFATRRIERDVVIEPQASTSLPSGRSSVLTRPAFWLLAIGFTLLVMNHGVILNHLLPLLHERGIAPDTAVLAAAMIGPMQVAGRVAMMLAQRHVSMRAIMLACFVGVCAATLLLMAAGLVPALLVGFVVLQGASYGVVSIVRPAMTRQVLGSVNFGAISGAMAVPYLLGVALAPTLGSLVWLVGGYGLVLAVIFVAAVIGGVLGWMATRV
ncbi:MFS transporter [Pararhizobium haloflavum]|uniref:MFS transporter n=1 Tax=Pararhizobium haloflavum TaxID=2037914 RepID=UPI000C17F7CD|nr:MFS transporter [Pararhizobium haloflavum]